ncbi:MAG: hypothetical protein KAQ83_02010 [Nanoarchaeota archaeon]|nr:hypothetical protein [Nanoarchaeota archaeon]
MSEYKSQPEYPFSTAGMSPDVIGATAFCLDEYKSPSGLNGKPDTLYLRQALKEDGFTKPEMAQAMLSAKRTAEFLQKDNTQ